MIRRYTHRYPTVNLTLEEANTLKLLERLIVKTILTPFSFARGRRCQTALPTTGFLTSP
ncbi:hypothetical protein [Paraburkholderia caribensis]|uniref:hypothetical protein n=1 Tax=Paraburkholderia caribensis TaxID=75105 RepID=UPI000B2C5485|nr:hypothetical protein [Paraburkholderia caribensis]